MTLGDRSAAAGDYLVVDESGDIFFCASALFELMFERCPDNQIKVARKAADTSSQRKAYPTPNGGKKRGDVLAVILGALAGGGKKATEIRDSCGLHPGTVSSTLQRLRRQGRVKNDGGTWSLIGGAA